MFLKTINLVLLLSALSSGINSETVSNYLKLADASYKEKHYRQALSYYRSAMHLNPDSSKSILGFAKSSLALGSLEDAKLSFLKILDKDKKNKDAISGLGEIYSLEGKFEESLSILEEGLRDEPYNPTLLITRATVYLRMGKNEIALRRLEEAKSKVNSNYEYNLLLARAYTANKKYKQANEIITTLINEYPENPESFLEKAKLNFELASKETNDETLVELMNDSFYRLETALKLDRENVTAKRLMIKNYIWLDQMEEALRLCEELLINFPSDTTLLYYHAFLSSRLNKDDKAADSYSQLLKLEDLNAIARYAAYRFAVSKLSEKHSLRLYLGRNRLEQYKKFIDEYAYSIANFQLHLAKDLIPENRELKKVLIDHYYKFGNRRELLKMLLKYRIDDPDDIKINNRLEAVLKGIKDSLTYKEGLMDGEGKLISGIRNQSEIFLFDLKPMNFLPDYPNASIQLTHAIKYSISLKSSLKVLEPDDEKKVRKALSSGKPDEKYTNAIYFNPNVLNKLNLGRKSEDMIRYIGYGEFQIEKGEIKVNFNLYDRITGRIIENSLFSVSGRNSVGIIATRIAEVVTKKLPIVGKIIKLKSDSAIINLGFRDGIKKGNVFTIESESKEFGDIEIVETDEYISKGVINFPHWKETVGTGFKVKLKFTSKEKEKKETN
ncbi:MAG: tetratricopeptide repeat protein [Leptospiraceae bacterium]|nr:tetratricopeptide repeat protein [Leptospiraceae bacterium]